MTAVKILSRTFYQHHAIFFLGVIFVCFGFVGSNEHLAIARFLAKAAGATLVICAIWTMYVVYAGFYINNLLKTPAYLFLRDVALGQPAITFTTVALIVLFPVHGYGVFILSVGNPTLTVLFTITGYVVLSTAAFTLFISYKVKRPVTERMFSIALRLRTARAVLGQPSWYLQHLVFRGSLFFFTKLASIATSMLFIRLYVTDSYDWRLFGLSAVVIAGIHLPAIKDHVQYLEISKSYFYNLPRSIIQWWKTTLTLVLTLMVPEGLLLFYHMWATLSIATVVSIWSLTVSLIVLLHQLHLVVWLEPEVFYRYTFWLSIALVFLVMFSVPPSMLAITFLLISLSLQRQFYRKLPER